MITSQEYRERIRAMRPNVYIDGEIVKRTDPRIELGMNVVALTYDLAQQREYAGLFTATSHLSRKQINRFCHIHRTAEDLLKKQEMTRIYSQQCAGCIQRCMGTDALNALSVVTYDIDQAHGTPYHQRFLEYLKHFQESDICANCAQTDVKGDRSKRPHQQADPDLYLRVVERRADGIVVRGAKAHNSIAPYADEIIVLPTRSMTSEEGDWAVAFATPADAPGLRLVSRFTRYGSRQKLEAPIAHYGDLETLTIFDDVVVPWERVFLCGEREFAGPLALLFALFHRHSYTGCKPAVSDVLMGAAALVAEYSGIEGKSHVEQKLAEMIGVAELVYAAGIASAIKGKLASSGTFMPNVLYSNAGRRYAGENIYHEYQIVADLAGGLATTLPFEGDFLSKETGPLLSKYLMRNVQVTAEKQYRCFQLIHDLVSSDFAGESQVAGLHGGGTPILEAIAMLKSYDMESKKQIARNLAGIED